MMVVTSYPQGKVEMFSATGRWSRVRRGFTLIEMLVVFMLVALLVSIAVPKYLRSVDVAKHRARSQNIATIRDAIDKFSADQGRRPKDLTELVSKQYLRDLPVDPVSESTAWVLLPDPNGVDPGVYDVAAPAVSEQAAPDDGSPASQERSSGGK
jgi:general secretion pathway protein G